ncbi:cupin domain-containing protein [Pseudokineococcus basanitobsidens]|uniref:cupin domain-containing protein n=1 Tax=Pseudokineococcus basanitobsidens TaxID=1926649 RepID=UPI003BB5B7CE
MVGQQPDHPVSHVRRPADDAGLAALRRVVGGSADGFGARTWGLAPLLTRAEDLPRGFDDLLSARAVDELVSERGLRTPFLRVAKQGSTLPERSFTAGGGVGAAVGDQVSDDRLTRLFADGATMVLQGLHRTWPPLVTFAQSLAADLGHPVQVNAYVTPPQSRGFDDHYDVHDVFVLQVEGEKRWRIHRPVHPWPMRDQPWTSRRADVEAEAAREPLLDVVLRPGDCLYLPRGYLHAATALGGVSTHLTVGVHPWTRHALADQLVRTALADLADDEDVRASLPFGVAVDDPSATADDLELVRERLLRAVEAVDAARVAAPLAAQVRSNQRAAPVGPLAQLRAARQVEDGGATDALVLREHLAASLVARDDGGALLRSRAGDLPLAADDVDAVRSLLDRGGDAGTAALDADLARRLVLAGVLVPR